MNGFFRTRTMDQHVTIDELICNPGDDYKRKFIFGIIISITLCSEKPTNMYQRGPGGKKGNSQSMSFRRMIRVFDPMTPPGGINTFTILEGCGNNTRVFSLDLSRRDDGTFCEFVLVSPERNQHRIVTFHFWYRSWQFCCDAQSCRDQKLHWWCERDHGSKPAAGTT